MINQYQDSYEQATESVTKSSGFSSFSSLLSTNENPIIKRSRSKSMPTIYMPTRLSTDSGDMSLESHLDLEKIKRRSDIFNEKENSLLYDYSNTLQSSLETDEICLDNQQQRCPTSEMQRHQRTMANSLHDPKTQTGKIDNDAMQLFH
jgi:hypothetical protein